MTRNTLTYLYNKMWQEIERQKLELELRKLAETIRNNSIVNSINKEKNRITRLANNQLNQREIQKLGESIRHNIQTELETNRSNMSNEAIKMLQTAIDNYDAETRRLNLEIEQGKLGVNSRQADTAEKKLVTDILGSALKGAAVVGIGKVVHELGKAQASKAFIDAMKPITTNPGALASLGATAAALGTKIVGIVSGVGSTVGKFMASAPFAALTGFKMGSDLSMMEIGDSSLFKGEPLVYVPDYSGRNEVKSMKESIVHGFSKMNNDIGGISNANSSKSTQNDASFGSGSIDPRGPGYNLGESTNKSSSGGARVIYSPGAKENKETGPGIGLAFS